MKWHLPVFIFILLIVLLLNFVIALKAYSVDLGILGGSAPIAEEDFEVHIVKQLEALGEDKLKAHQEMIKDTMVAKIKRPRAVKNISKATTTTSRLYDPSFVIQEDIYTDKNQLFYAHGTRVNPLEKRAFVEIWILIDGDDQTQVDFAKNYQEEQNETKTDQTEKSEINNKVKKIILLNGVPGTQADKSFFFFDQAGEISRKLNISKVPSVIRQAPNSNQILIEEISLDNKESD